MPVAARLRPDSLNIRKTAIGILEVEQEGQFALRGSFDVGLEP